LGSDKGKKQDQLGKKKGEGVLGKAETMRQADEPVGHGKARMFLKPSRSDRNESTNFETGRKIKELQRKRRKETQQGKRG